MSAQRLAPIAVLLAVTTTFVCLQSGLWDRPLRMDNRLYFYLAERAASGVPLHVSAPDVKNQLSTLVDATSITLGRQVGLDDVHSGRLGLLAVYIAGVWGTAMTVYALGATPFAAVLGALSVLGFTGMTGHTAVGSNPKILLFTLLAWVPYLAACGRFAAAGAVATGAMMCWQPAAGACLAVAAAALTTDRRARSLTACIAGGVAVFALYESYFAWHGVLAAQLFQSYVLPLGSVHEPADWQRGLQFVTFGGSRGIENVGLLALSFFLFTAAALAKSLGARLPDGGRADAPTAGVVVIVVGGLLATLFTAYEHQGAPDRFLLCAYFAASLGVVTDRILTGLRRVWPGNAATRAEGGLATLLLLSNLGGDGIRLRDPQTLAQQIQAGRIVAMLAESYGSVWSQRSTQLLGLAHLTNHHPLDHVWDDLEIYVDEDKFTPAVRGQLPDVILSSNRFSRSARYMRQYHEIDVPALAPEKVRAFLRKDLVEEASSWPK